jgi:hypothetical protein
MDTTERDEIIKATKAKHKTLYIYEIPNDEQGRFILFRQANPSDLAKFRENSNHEQLQYQKEEVISISCLAYPTVPEFTAIVQDFPAIPYQLANEIWRNARGGDSVAKKV